MNWMVSAAPIARRGEVMGALMGAAVAGELVGAPIGALADDVGTEIVFGSLMLLAAGLIMLALTVPPVAEAAGQTAREAIAAVRRRGTDRFVQMLVAIGGPCVATGLIMVLLPLRFDELGISAWLLAGALTVMSLVSSSSPSSSIAPSPSNSREPGSGITPDVSASNGIGDWRSVNWVMPSGMSM